MKKFKSTQMNIKTIKALKEAIESLLEFQQDIASLMELIYEDVTNRDYILENINEDFIAKYQGKLRKLYEIFEALFTEVSKYSIGGKMNFNKIIKNSNAKSIYNGMELLKINDKLERFQKFYEVINISIIELGNQLIKMNPEFDNEKYEIGEYMTMNKVIGIMLSIMNELIADEVNQIEEHLKIVKKYA